MARHRWKGANTITREDPEKNMSFFLYKILHNFLQGTFPMKIINQNSQKPWIVQEEHVMVIGMYKFLNLFSK